jgi:hypothetical protein
MKIAHDPKDGWKVITNVPDWPAYEVQRKFEKIAMPKEIEFLSESHKKILGKDLLDELKIFKE